MTINLGKFVTTTNRDQVLYLCKKHEINAMVRNWRHNRPLDSVRSTAIQEYYESSNCTMIDGIVYAWLLGKQLFIYDGWNRYAAAKDSMKLLLNVFDTQDEGRVKDHFRILNSAVPIPEIYETTYDDDAKKSIIMNVVERFEKKYADLKKPSKKPHAPHFNRDRFTSLLCDLEIDWNTVTEKSLWDALMAVNTFLTEELHQGFPTKAHIKAREHGMSLFLIKDGFLAKRLTEQINQKPSSLVSKLVQLVMSPI